jgi:hypothetical protein
MARSSDNQSHPDKPSDFTEEERQHRFEKLVQAALNTPPKSLKDRPKKRAESKAKKAAKPSS